MNKKTAKENIIIVMEKVIGIALLVCLFAGGFGCVGYFVALGIGGETATNICVWMIDYYYAILIKIGTITTVAIFVMMYINGSSLRETKLCNSRRRLCVWIQLSSFDS